MPDTSQEPHTLFCFSSVEELKTDYNYKIYQLSYSGKPQRKAQHAIRSGEDGL